MRATLTGLAFAGALSSRLLSKCRRRSGRCSSHEACCNRHFNTARRTVLRASHPARHHQVLPGIRSRAPRLPPLLSLVVVVKPGSILGLRAAGEAGSPTLLPTDASAQCPLYPAPRKRTFLDPVPMSA